jgi:hypothetical protein
VQGWQLKIGPGSNKDEPSRFEAIETQFGLDRRQKLPARQK